MRFLKVESRKNGIELISIFANRAVFPIDLLLCTETPTTLKPCNIDVNGQETHKNATINRESGFLCSIYTTAMGTVNVDNYRQYVVLVYRF